MSLHRSIQKWSQADIHRLDVGLLALGGSALGEGVFTPQHTLASAQEFYRDLKGHMRSTTVHLKR